MKKVRTWLRSNPFLIRLGSWEYWPMHLIYTPIYLYWIFLAAKSRAFFFFTATNPGIAFGGLMGDSKKDILDKIPDEWIPQTLFFKAGTDPDIMLSRLHESGLRFPVILKPDIGERGFLVEKVETAEKLRELAQSHQVDWLIQEYVAYTEEVSILYYRFPEARKGHITSVTLKEFLQVTGDGAATLRELITQNPRAYLQMESLEKREGSQLDRVPVRGEIVELMPIGNHSRGTTFLNGNAHIDQALHDTFDHISHRLKDIYFGRFDIRCESLESLKEGRNFKILEINGVKAEPTHIYQPGFSLREAYRILFRQWRTIYEISIANRERGVQVPTFREGLVQVRAFLRYKKQPNEPMIRVFEG